MKPLPRLLYKINKLRWHVTRPTTVGVRLILVRDGTVLLVMHTYQRDWYLPGGAVRRGEALEEAARREACEEIGADMGHLHLHSVYSNSCEHKSDHVVVFSCDDFSLTGETDREIESFRFSEFDNLPTRVSPGSMRRIREHMDGDDMPVIGLW